MESGNDSYLLVRSAKISIMAQSKVMEIKSVIYMYIHKQKHPLGSDGNQLIQSNGQMTYSVRPY